MSPVPTYSVRSQLEKILASPLFVRSGRMSRFLRYTVELALSGKSEDIKEYRIGVDVFDRKPDYDPRVDPIVRVEARRLRQKLCAYYDADGKIDEIVIDFEKGTYVPAFRLRDSRENHAPEPRTGTVAVLPFTDLSPEGGNAYFADGLTEELIHALTRVDGLCVVAWNTAAQLRGREQDIRGIAEELHVSSVLTGSIRMSGARLRVRSQLIEASTGVYLWSETWDREVRDVFSIQEEIARAIVRTLRIHRSGGPAESPMARPASNIDSFDLYLKGRYHWNMRTDDGLQRSVKLFMGAIALDERNPIAYAGLADAYSLMADYHLMSPADAMPKARQAAQRAIELAPDLAEAWTSLAYIRSMYDWEWKEAESFYLRAIELNPGYATAHFWLSMDYYALLGRHDEARKSLDTALVLDPLSQIMRDGKGFLMLVRRDYAGALAYYVELSNALPLFHRAWTAMGRVLIQMGRYDEALESFERGRAIAGDIPHIIAPMAQAHAFAGRRDEARRLLAQLHGMAETRYLACTSLCLVHIALGEFDKALNYLETACQRREMSLAQLKVHPIYDRLRAEPRFQKILRTVHPEG